MIRRLVIAAAVCPALHAEPAAVDILRVEIPSQGIVWDAPAEWDGMALSARASWIRRWSLATGNADAPWHEAKLVGTCVPSAKVTVKTLDPEGKTPRTRIDQPFTLDIEIGGLLTDMGLPESVSQVLLERHLRSGAHEETRSACISSNGLTRLRFPASALVADDATRARGVEEFEVHTLAGDGSTPTRIGGAEVRVLPVASGTIGGVEQGGIVREAPRVTAAMTDLYPMSETRLIVFKGTTYQAVTGTTLRTRKLRGDECVDAKFAATDLDPYLAADGTYTLALVSDTIYGRELLAEPVTFHLRRQLQASVR